MIYAVCKISNTRSFYAVWSDWCEPPAITGFQPTLEAACATALALAGPGASVNNAYNARLEYRRLHVEPRRAAKTAKESRAGLVEHVWARLEATYDPDDRVSAEPYRVHKKTKNRIYVEDRPGDLDRIARGEREPHTLETFVLDRATIERGEAAYRSGGGWWGNSYYMTEALALATRTRSSLPPHIAEAVGRLGLSQEDLDQAKVKSAYRRLALRLHPDHAGSEESFRRLEEDYSQVSGHFPSS